MLFIAIALVGIYFQGRKLVEKISRIEKNTAETVEGVKGTLEVEFNYLPEFDVNVTSVGGRQVKTGILDVMIF